MHERFNSAARAAARARFSAAVVPASILASALIGPPALAAHKGGVSPGWDQCRSPDPDARIAGCMQVIQEIEKENPHNRAAAYVNRAGAYQAKGDYAHALEDFGKALEIDPKSSVIVAARGAAYHAKGDLDSALADYDRAIALDNKNAAALLARAYIWRAKGDVEKALADLEEAAKADPKSTAPLVTAGALHHAKGDHDRAIAAFEGHDYVHLGEEERHFAAHPSLGPAACGPGFRPCGSG